MVPDTWIFHVTWYDHQADIVKQLTLSYRRSDNCVELYDPKLRRLFLRRTPAPMPLEDHLYVGNTVTIVSRQLKIVDYGDERTRCALAPRFQKAVMVVKPHAQEHLGSILQRLLDSGFALSSVQMVQLDNQKAKRLLEITAAPWPQSENRDGGGQVDDAFQSFTDGKAVVVEIVGNDSEKRLKYIVGPDDPAKARQQSPSSLRASYGISRSQNAVYWSAPEDNNLLLLSEFVSGISAVTPSEISHDCSCCVIKPSALKYAGNIVDEILSHGFRITAVQSFHLSRNAADEFYEVYKTVLPEYPQMVDELAQGVCLAMQVEHAERDSVAQLRQLSGPYDPEVARFVRPQSLRAKFGSDRVRNAVHCTDLDGDAILEVQYFFSVLAHSRQ